VLNTGEPQPRVAKGPDPRPGARTAAGGPGRERP
jgi:hypothetical protein